MPKFQTKQISPVFIIMVSINLIGSVGIVYNNIAYTPTSLLQCE